MHGLSTLTLHGLGSFVRSSPAANLCEESVLEQTQLLAVDELAAQVCFHGSL